MCHLGGLGKTVLYAVTEERDIVVKKFTVMIPCSGPFTVLFYLFGISAKNIVAAVIKFNN